LKAEWNYLRWVFQGTVCYEKISLGNSTVEAYEAWRSMSWRYFYWDGRRRPRRHILSLAFNLMANKGDIIIMFSRIEHCAQRKISLWFNYYIKILVRSPLLFIKLAARNRDTQKSTNITMSRACGRLDIYDSPK